MDPKTARERALVETERFFLEKFGTAPAEDSDEWEDEYRRQFNRWKNEPTPSVAAGAPAAIVEDKPADLPDLVGTPADARWAFALRSARLTQIQNRDLRAWLARTSIKAKDWIDTRDLSIEAFLRRVEPSHDEARRHAASEAASAAAARDAQETAAAALRNEIEAAGISAAGLVDLIDVSPRTASLPIKDKLAEFRLEGRTVRVFETANPAILMVLEKREDQRSDYGIERDEGLVADLKLFARSGL
jgi:hypothetical protein